MNKLKQGTIALSWGKYGGFYFLKGKSSTRLCLGWIAFTYYYQDLDEFFEGLISQLNKALR